MIATLADAPSGADKLLLDEERLLDPWLSEAHHGMVARVGWAVTRWARLEDELFRLCLHLLGAGKRKAAVVYYRTPQLSARLSLLNDLWEACAANGELPSSATPGWADIRKEIEGRLQVRNALAHQPLEAGAIPPRDPRFDSEDWMAMRDARVNEADVNGWFVVETSPYERLRKGKGQRIDYVSIREHFEAIAELTVCVRRLRESLSTGRP